MTSSPPWAAMRASWGADVLHRNQMDGTFHDQTAATGLDSVPIVSATGEAGMAAADFSNDGWPDLYLGRVELANRLFLNDGEGRFSDASTVPTQAVDCGREGLPCRRGAHCAGDVTG